MEKLFQKKQLLQRSLTALILVPLMLFVIIMGKSLYAGFFTLITLVSLLELKNMIKKDKPWIVPTFLTIFLLLLFLISMILLRQKGLYYTLYLVLLVWITDTMAYVFGNLIGGKKLAPKISPKKTISGFLGGILSAALFSYFANHFSLILWYNNLLGALVGLYLGIFSQLGDLLESALKRHFGVKDSGKILPGHGGLLDRFDGMIMASVAILPLIFL